MAADPVPAAAVAGGFHSSGRDHSVLFSAESGLSPTNLQNTYHKKLGMIDEAYTRAVDHGSYKNFVHDGAGYGLAQWTFWSRKQALLNFCKSAEASIGDLDSQVSFLLKELSEGYSGVMAVLRSASTVRDASDAMLLGFERPADQSDAVQKKRATYSQQFYDKYAGTKGDELMMSNSSLVSYTKISPNRTEPRNRHYHHPLLRRPSDREQWLQCFSGRK